MENTIQFIALLSAGFLLKKLPDFPASTDRSLNLFIIYIALPGLIMSRVPSLEISSDILIPVSMAWATVAISAITVLGIAKLLSWPKNVKGALLLMVPLGNTSFLGVPMVEHFYGMDGVAHALIYDQFGSFMALSTYGTLILAVYGGQNRVSSTQIVKKILTFPPFLSLCVALILPAGIYPQWMKSLFHMTAQSLVPVVLVAIGFAMEITLDRKEIIPLLTGLTIRLIYTPTLIICCCYILGLSNFATKVSILETAMPPMVTAGALASIAGLKPRLTASMVGIGILFSFITLPVIYYISP